LIGTFAFDPKRTLANVSFLLSEAVFGCYYGKHRAM
jgi:hypothetical protein